MKFADPLWFLLFLPLAALAYFLDRSWKERSAALPYSDLSLLAGSIRETMPEKRILLALKFAALALIVTALARPQKVSSFKEPPRPVVDIVMCLDTSMSMSALDFDPDNRLDAAKKAAEEFIRKRLVDRIGLVVFGGKALVQCPLTLDHETLIDFLRTVPMNATQVDGTAIGTALASASNLLGQSEAKTKIIILLTDGRSNQGSIDPMTAAQAANDLKIKIYTIGCAVPGGGMVPVEDPVFGKRLVKMAEDLDEPTLQGIAASTGARYFRVTSSQRFKEIYNEIDKLEKTKIEVSEIVQVRDLYLPLLILAMILFSGASILDSTLWRTLP